MFLSAALAPAVAFYRRLLHSLWCWLWGGASDWRRSCRCQRRARFGRLRLVGPQEAVFKRRAVETADDGCHLFRIRRVDEGEPFRLLCFRVADDFDIV